MINKKNFTDAFVGKNIGSKTTVAIVAGVAIGAVIGTFFLTRPGKKLRTNLGNFIDQLRGNTPKKAREKLGNLIFDVRVHIKQNAEGLLGPTHYRNDPAQIYPKGVPSNAWKN
jgi:hypothetical protein